MSNTMMEAVRRPRKPPSKAQQWARERNWNKARLTSIVQTLKNMSYQKSTTTGEKLDYEMVVKLLAGRVSHWSTANKLSKSQFLKGD